MVFSSKHEATEPKFASNFREGVKTLTLAFALLFAVLYDAWRDGFFAYFFPIKGKGPVGSFVSVTSKSVEDNTGWCLSSIS